MVDEIKLKWMRFVVLFLLLGSIFILVMRKCYIKTFFSVVGTLDQGNIVLILPVEKLQGFLETYEVRIQNKNYSYKLVSIGEELFTVDNQLLKKVVIEVHLPNELLKQNNTFTVFLSYEEKNIFRILESCFKE